MSLRFSIVLALSLMFCGCGRKAENESAAPASAPKKVGVSVDAGDAPPPPPVANPAPTADAAPPPPGDTAPEPPKAEMTPEAAMKQFADADRAEKAYQERLKRNAKWMEGLKSANAGEQQRVLGEIRAAKLSAAEIQELEAIKQYFGVTVSFR